MEADIESLVLFPKFAKFHYCAFISMKVNRRKVLHIRMNLRKKRKTKVTGLVMIVQMILKKCM